MDDSKKLIFEYMHKYKLIRTTKLISYSIKETMENEVK